MHCGQARELFSDYIAKTTDSALTVILENHLAGCASCREEAEGMRRVWTMLDAMPLAEPPAFFHENAMSRFDALRAGAEETAARKRALWDWRGLFRPRALAYGASVLVLLLTGAEVVQTQRAQIGPVGYVASLFRQAPYAVEIERTSPTTVTLSARVNSMSALDARDGIACKVQVAGRPDISFETRLSADSAAPFALTLPEELANQSVTVEVTFAPAAGEATTLRREVSAQ